MDRLSPAERDARRERELATARRLCARLESEVTQCDERIAELEACVVNCLDLIAEMRTYLHTEGAQPRRLQKAKIDGLNSRIAELKRQGRNAKARVRRANAREATP